MRGSGWRGSSCQAIGRPHHAAVLAPEPRTLATGPKVPGTLEGVSCLGSDRAVSFDGKRYFFLMERLRPGARSRAKRGGRSVLHQNIHHRLFALAIKRNTSLKKFRAAYMQRLHAPAQQGHRWRLAGLNLGMPGRSDKLARARARTAQIRELNGEGFRNWASNYKPRTRLHATLSTPTRNRVASYLVATAPSAKTGGRIR